MEGSRLHAEIMNLNVEAEKIKKATNEAALKTGDKFTALELAYKLGHRDARHAAAELALKP